MWFHDCFFHPGHNEWFTCLALTEALKKRCFPKSFCRLFLRFGALWRFCFLWVGGVPLAVFSPVSWVGSGGDFSFQPFAFAFFVGLDRAWRACPQTLQPLLAFPLGRDPSPVCCLLGVVRLRSARKAGGVPGGL